jgi:hypothetical protein
MPILSRLPRSVRSFPTSIYYDTSSARAGASTFFDFFMNFLCFLKIRTAKKACAAAARLSGAFRKALTFSGFPLDFSPGPAYNGDAEGASPLFF